MQSHDQITNLDAVLAYLPSDWGIVIFLLLASLLWYFKPRDRRQVLTCLIAFFLSISAVVVCNMLTTSSMSDWVTALKRIGEFVVGISYIRLGGLLAFRLMLPLCRVKPLRIFEDLAELVGYCAWLMVSLHVVGLELSSLVTTSAVMTAILAFSMQDTLGNILGGLALQLDNSLHVGDWISVNDVNGRVVDIRWRYTAVETRNWETVIIPNSQLMKSNFRVIGRRKGKAQLWRRFVYFEVGYEHLAGHVINVVREAVRLGHIPNVAENPPANCLLTDFNASAARYAVVYWLSDLEADGTTDSTIRIRIYAALQRAGIQLPYPQYQVHLTNKDENYLNSKLIRRQEERVRAIGNVELFDALNEGELLQLADKLVYTPFAQGDLITRQGDIAHSLYILVNGKADVFLETVDGRRQIDSLQAPTLIGEMGLMTGTPRSASVVAKTEVLAFRLDKASFQYVLQQRPELAVEMSHLLSNRLGVLENLQQQLDGELLAANLSQNQNSLLVKIRQFFSL